MNKDRMFRKIDFMKNLDSKQTTLEGEVTEDAKANNYSKPKPIITEQDKLKASMREASEKRIRDEKLGKKPREKKLDLF